ncbi:glycosyltransferase [Algibacter sp. AS12]|uniref:glycosyltransferase family 2 protein n=1 Tax=Algibacter sp. AS12 TaxID=3135773 RepID=UPI00398B9554
MKPLLSICCTSYNHENYIKETLDGFLMQKTNFPIEILIHDDASTDRSAEIIKEYAQKDGRIITILQTENQYSKKIKPWPNFLFPMAKGKYLALCEGDDYWIDPLKLQKQVDFLETHSDFNICFNASKIYIQDTNTFKEDPFRGKFPEILTIKDLARKNYIRTNTVVMRNNFTLPEWFNQLPFGDWPMYLIMIKDNKVKYIDDVMGVYRIHSEGVWSGKDKAKMIEMTLIGLDMLIKSNILPAHINKILLKRYRKYAFKAQKEKFRGYLKSR